MFGAEVRFYREVAPVVGVRVPKCYRAEETADGTLLVLEDLSAWQPGADPAAAARILSGLHARWSGVAQSRWPWLRAGEAGVDLVAALYDRTWPDLAARRELAAGALDLGERLVGGVASAEAQASRVGPVTLTHGDASASNMRTGPDGEIALLDWEDVSAAAGVADLAWLLVSSVDPDRWDEVIAAYGPAAGLDDVLPALAVQGLLSMADSAPGSDAARGWVARLAATAARLADHS
jgi:hypothetical protein